jgi:hypothetical protein
VGVDLSYQDFATELATLPGRYGSPMGSDFVSVKSSKTAYLGADMRWLSAAVRSGHRTAGTVVD